MDNKLLINVSVPIIESDFDLFIPINKKVGVVKDLIINSIIELTFGVFKPNDKMELYIKENGRLLDGNVYVKEANIFNGEKIVLF